MITEMSSRLLAAVATAFALHAAAVAIVVERQIAIPGETTLHAWHAGTDLGVGASTISIPLFRLT